MSRQRDAPSAVARKRRSPPRNMDALIRILGQTMSDLSAGVIDAATAKAMADLGNRLYQAIKVRDQGEYTSGDFAKMTDADLEKMQ